MVWRGPTNHVKTLLAFNECQYESSANNKSIFYRNVPSATRAVGHEDGLPAVREAKPR